MAPITVELERKSIFKVEGLAKIDSLAVGEKSVIQLRVRNSSGTDIYLGKASTTCGCVSVKTDRKELRDGATCNLEVQLNPDRKYSEKIWLQTISFEQVEKRGNLSSVSIKIQAGLAGVFTATPPRILFIATKEGQGTGDPEKLTKQITVTTTKPVRLDNLKIDGSDFLNLFDVTVSPDKSDPIRGAITLEIAPDDIPREGIHGSITLTDPLTKQRRLIAISMIRRQPIRVLPATLIVQRNRRTGVWSAFGMVLREGGVAESEDGHDTLAVMAKAEGKDMPVQLLGGGLRLQRFRLDLDQKLVESIFEDQAEARCQFEVFWGDQKAHCETDVAFPKR